MYSEERMYMTRPQPSCGSARAHGGLRYSLISHSHLHVNIPMCAMNLYHRIIWVLHFSHDL